MPIYKNLVQKISISPDKKTKQKNYLKQGQIAIIDQGQPLIGGYTDDDNMIVSCDLPVIVFGDHTRVVKYISFPFGAGADGIKVLQPKPDILPKLLYYATQFLVLRLENKGYARHYQHLEKKELDVPPIPEQERIVARIEELFSQLDSGVETLKRIKQQLAVYRQAVLKEAFKKYYDFVPLGQISERIFDGPFGSHLKTADYTDNGVRVVRLENVKSGWFDDSKQSYVSPEKYETIFAHTVYPSDLIISTFISESIKICQLPKSIEFAVNKADCVGIRLQGDIHPKFIMFYLLSRQAYMALIHQVHGATRPRINTKQIKAILVPLANGDMQEETIAEVESKLSICDSIEQTVGAALQQAEAMRQSILKKAFEGELK